MRFLLKKGEIVQTEERIGEPESDDDVFGEDAYDAAVAAEDGHGIGPSHALAVPLHPEAGLAPFPQLSAQGLAEDFSILLRLRELPEIFEMVWRATRPPDVGRLAVLPQRPRALFTESFARGLGGGRFPAAGRPASYIESLCVEIADRTQGAERNWDILASRYAQILRRVDGERELYRGMERLYDLSPSPFFDARLQDPLGPTIMGVRGALCEAPVRNPDFGGDDSFDAVGRHLSGVGEKLAAYIDVLEASLLGAISRSLHVLVLDGLPWRGAEWYEPDEARREVVDRVLKLARRHRRVDHLPLVDGLQHRGLPAGLGDEYRVAAAHVSARARRLRRDGPEMECAEVDDMLRLARRYLRTMDDDATGLGRIVEQYQTGVLDLFATIRGERQNAFRDAEGDYHVHMEEYHANLLPTVARIFDQASRGYPLRHPWVPGRPLNPVVPVVPHSVPGGEA